MGESHKTAADGTILKNVHLTVCGAKRHCEECKGNKGHETGVAQTLDGKKVTIAECMKCNNLYITGEALPEEVPAARRLPRSVAA